MKKNTVYLCIGGNLGEREANLEETREFLEFNFGDVVETSSVYESEGWEMENVPAFLNQVVKIETELTPLELLQEIAELEEFYGRERKTGIYLSREMDVDVLLYNDEIVETEKLIVPHPKMAMRRFVLEPLNEIAPDLVHPMLKKTIAELLKDCEDKSVLKKIKA
jgi:2-amino-4-hydroxy-6-hydroxymethyldihydropteridine diphosphokinase